MDLERRWVHRPGGDVPLTEQEAALLRYLIARPGMVIRKEVLLTEVMGYTSTVVTRALDAAMSRLRQKVEVDSTSAVHFQTVRGVGYRFEPAPACPASLEDPDGVNVLPPELDPWVGRTETLAAIEQDLDGGATLVSVLGGPGAGKTRTAVHVGHRMRDRGWAVTFLSVGDDLSRSVADGLGVPGATETQVRSLLSLGRILVILDGLDAADPRPIDRWRAEAPSARWLVTARAPLKLPGERRHTLGPMSSPEATALLSLRAGAVRPGWGAGADPEISRIVGALDGNPLALELGAGRAVVLSPSELAAAVDTDDRFRVLTGLHAAIAGTWAWLSDLERRQLARCAVFPAPFTADDAMAVAEAGIDDLQALVERSVIRCRPDPDRTRFELDSSVRRFALDHLSDAEADATAARLHTRALEQGEAAVALLPTPRGEQAARELRWLVPALRAALARLSASDEGRDGAARVALVLASAWEVHGSAADRVQVLDEVDRPSLDRVLAVRVRLARSRAHRELASSEAARRDAERALGGLEAGDPPELVGRVSLELATLDTDDRRPAEAWLARALDIAEQTGDRELEARVHALLGRIAYAADALVRARDHFQRVDDAARALGAWRLTILGRLRLGLIARRENRLEEADACFVSALDLARAVGARELEASVHSNRVPVQILCGDLDAAVESAERALALHRRCAALLYEVAALSTLGVVRMARGELDVARELLTEALVLSASRGDARDQALVAGNLGRCLHARGDSAGARRLLEQAVATLEAPVERAYFESELAAVAAAQGDVDAAAACLDRVAGVLPGPAGQAWVTVIGGELVLARARALERAGRSGEAQRREARGRLAEARRIARALPARGLGMIVVPGELDAAIDRLDRSVHRP